MLSWKSTITVKILGYFFINPDRRHYINELVRILKVDSGNLFRKLQELQTEGLLNSEIVGRQRYFYLNKDCPLLEEYRNIYQTKFGLPELLKNKLKSIVGLKEAYIFGSYAHGNFQATSDIDLLLVGSHDHAEIFDVISPFEKILGREINIIDFSSPEFKAKRKANDDFLKHIFSHQVIRLL